MTDLKKEQNILIIFRNALSFKNQNTICGRLGPVISSVK